MILTVFPVFDAKQFENFKLESEELIRKSDRFMVVTRGLFFDSVQRFIEETDSSRAIVIEDSGELGESQFYSKSLYLAICYAKMVGFDYVLMPISNKISSYKNIKEGLCSQSRVVEFDYGVMSINIKKLKKFNIDYSDKSFLEYVNQLIELNV